MSTNNRIDFILFFDVENGNPNGDPDAGNMPRMDPETGIGLVTDACIKRKIRNYVSTVMAEEPGYEIHMAEKSVLNNAHKRAYDALGMAPVGAKKPAPPEITEWLCRTFFDIRTFGAVMTTDVNGGQVRGPLQFGQGNSIDPIMPIEMAVTRQSVTNEKDVEKERTMGRKFVVPYGLYMIKGFYNPCLAARTGFGEKDLDLVWSALQNMFDLDRSASRGVMSARDLIVFRHENRLGNAPASKLFDRVSVERTPGTEDRPARAFNDYRINVIAENMPAGVEVLRPWG